MVRTALGIATATGLAITTLVTMSPASAAGVPTFPDNLLVFPNRDFVSIEGYSGHAGETATVQITRNGNVMGSAKGVVSGGDVAFEVNHPGGICWGAGTPLNVTPDIQAGDVASISFPDGSSDSTTVSSATVSKDMTENGQTVTIEGTVGPEVNKDFMEQRVINLDLVAVIDKRDVRAVPGPLTPAPRGGYSSSLTFPTTNTFLATYQFDTQAGADTVAASTLCERAMSWEVQDPAGNRQGVTIAEFGEAGGPGMGNCPAGPGTQTAPAGSMAVTKNAAGDPVVTWTPVAPQPGADPVTGYSVEAVSAPDNNGLSSTRGVRLGASATQTTLTGLPAGSYTYEVRSMAGNKMSVPFTAAPTGPPPAPGDTTPPTLALNPNPNGTTAVETNSVTITSNGQVFYTTDGSPAILGDSPSDKAIFYNGPIKITGPTDLSVASFDQVGNHTELNGLYKPVAQAGPSAVTGLTGTVTQTSAALTWTASPAAENVTGYQVTVADNNGVKLTTQPPATSVPRQTVTGLKSGTTYQFTVVANNAGGSSTPTAALVLTTDKATDQIGITSAKWKLGDFRVIGTGSVVGNTVQAYLVKADGTRGAAITGASAVVTAPVPPATVGDFSIRVRTTGAPLNVNPGKILVVSSGGGVAGPFTVANG
jgi:hypothetical protein